jgi:crossover junction endodeoxyribonuclease RuvC
MIILGVDPGSTATGYGIIRKNGVRSIHVASGVIRPSAQWAMSRRLWEIHEKLDAVIRQHSPDVMVVESLFHFKNAQSLMKLSQVRGVILLMGERYGMRIFEYAPMEIKKGVTGYGAADKTQVIFMVGKVLGLPDLKSPDTADALAMALYHSHLCVPEKPCS